MPSDGTQRIYLSPPHMSGAEAAYVEEAFASNWIAPVGPHCEAFEREFCQIIGSEHAVALSSGTAALHLSLLLAGVQPGDEVMVSTLTFAASVNPILYVGARPVFVDSEKRSWNLDPQWVADSIERRGNAGRLPRAIVVVHLYGQSANLEPIIEVCDRFGIVVIEDAAEALGSEYQGLSPGTFGRAGIFSFNGNKIITTSGGGMLVSNDGDFVEHARRLAAQARDPAPHYEHSEIGFNYLLSNVLAAIGRAQLEVLNERVEACRQNFESYVGSLGDLPGLEFMPEASWGRHSRWLTTLTIDPDRFGADSEQVCLALERENIEARQVWKPMHLQPVFSKYESVGGGVAEDLFRRGLCLPSGSQMGSRELKRVIDVVRSVCTGGE